MGDEITRVEDEHNVWDTFEQLKTAVLGLGKTGTTIKVRVRRGEGTFDYELTRGLIEGFDIPYEVAQENFRTFLMDDYPDLKVSVKKIISEGDIVACYIESQGTDSDFPFAWYLSRVEGLIARNWNPRQLGFGKRAVVSCAVHFNIARGGAVSQATLVASSGIGVFDRESLRAVQTTSLPPLPPQYGGSSLGVTFIFNLEPGS